VHGHFLADALDGLFVSAAVSHVDASSRRARGSNYYHFQRAPDDRDACCRALHEHRLSLREFAELGWMRNEATRYLASKSLADLEFIGVSERFAESLQICAQMFAWPRPLSTPWDNINPRRNLTHLRAVAGRLQLYPRAERCGPRGLRERYRAPRHGATAAIEPRRVNRGAVADYFWKRNAVSSVEPCTDRPFV